MVFPDTPRVIYQRNPLAEVICQLRFPTDLRIAAAQPADFQHRIRDQYPEYKQRTEVPFVVPADATVQPSNTAHDFITSDKLWTVTLQSGFIALTCRLYTRWEEFRARMDQIVSALSEAYSPPYVTRTGLRYRDIIDVADLGVGDVPLPHLVNPALAAEFSVECLQTRVRESQHRVVVQLGSPGPLLALQYGWVVGQKPAGPCFVVDADFYDERAVPLSTTLRLLDEWNGEAGRMFRWVVQDALRDALGPKPLNDEVGL